MNDIEIKDKYLKYFERQRAAGARILAYDCPCCGESLDTLAPSRTNEHWDTMTTCPYCEQLHWKDVRHHMVTATCVPFDA